MPQNNTSQIYEPKFEEARSKVDVSFIKSVKSHSSVWPTSSRVDISPIKK